MKKVNDHEYWNERYATGDWEKYGGDQQAAFFAELAMNAFPEWLVRKMNEEALSVRDYGCARGSGTAFLAKHFPTCMFTGIDFSEDAIAFAKEQFNNCDFETGDLYTMELPPCDVVFSSNTLEHMRAPKKILCKLVESARKYAVILLPLDDTTDHSEHFFKFGVDFFPEKVGQMVLGYFHIIDCRDGGSPYWKGKQILLVYVHPDCQEPTSNMLSEISKKSILPQLDTILELQRRLDGMTAEYQSELEKIEKNNQEQLRAAAEKQSLEIERLNSQNEEQQRQISEAYEKKIKHLHESIRSQIEELNAIHQQESEKAKTAAENEKQRLILSGEQALEEVRVQLAELQENYEKKVAACQDAVASEKKRLTESCEEKVAAYKGKAETISREWRQKYALLWQNSNTAVQTMQMQQEQIVSQWQAKYDQLAMQLQQEQTRAGQNEQIILQMNQRMSQIQMLAANVIDTGKALSGNKSFKLVHFISRWRTQYQNGNRSEKKAFRAWLRSRAKGKAAFDTTFNPLYQMINPLKTVQGMAYGQAAWSAPAALPAVAEPGAVGLAKVDGAYSYPAWFLSEAYQKYDVVVFAVIDYDFRYQRPQQIADHFVREGHRVFYINANFTKNEKAEVQKQENLFKVSLSSRNHNAVYSLNEEEDCKEIYDQLDSLLIKYGIRDALMIADYPTWIDSISRLKERYGFNLVTDYMDDFTGFLSTTEPFVKDCCLRLLALSDAVVASSQYLVDVAKQYNDNVFPIRNGTEFEHFNRVFGKAKPKDRKVIGYYGAIAEWFDFSKIEYLAKRFSDCDIVLIGDITNEKVKACNLPNVKKLGEKPYRDLPEMLADFDVCLIPFDTSTNLIKATNPVKFYEYLSAGKKIVATEIPELEPFRDKYVYLANRNRDFGDYVELCLNGKDKLASPEKCAAFALENDWSKRVKAFEDVATKTFPRVSVIVLCYNQLDYTRQCVESILNNTAYPNYELVLVDNNSTDDTAAYLKKMEKQDSHVKIVLNKTNRGFAGGNNDGIEASDGEYLILLNNDTLVTRGWMTNMVKHCRANERVGIVGAVTNSIGNEAQISVEYMDIADMPAFAYGYTAAHMNEIYPHDGVLAMFCVMFSRHMVDLIGMLDENYGIGMFEDDDYSVAASRAGFELILPEDVFIHHFGSVSFKKLEDEKHRKLFEKNKAYFEQKWGTAWHMHHYRNK